jgi:hypothetical protein
MSYAQLLESESIEQQILAVIVPKRRVTSFTLYSGSIYSAAFDYGEVVKVKQDSVELTRVYTTSLLAGQYYYDIENQILYVRNAAGNNPNSFNLIAYYELYYGTYDAHLNRDPLDTNSRVVYYEPLILRAPNVRMTQAQNQFGYIPVQSSQIEISNYDHSAEKHLYDSSFANAEINVYHVLKDSPDIDSNNIELIYSGQCGDVDYNSSKFTIRINSVAKIFDAEYRHATGDSYYSTSNFPNLDQKFEAKPIRKVYGYVRGFVPVNISYVSENPTTSDNRTWAVMNGQSGLGEVVKTISGGSTTTRTYLNNVQGINVDDTIFLDGSPNDHHVIVTAVNTSPAYIEHAAIASAMTSGSARRGFVSRIDIIQNNVKYTALYNRDYTITTGLASEASGFIFSASLEANTSMPETLSPNDTVICRVYGRLNDQTFNALPFGSNDARTGNLANPALIAYDILKNILGVSEDRLDSTSFSASITANDFPVGMAIPESSTSDFKDAKQYIIELLKPIFGNIYVKENKWTLSFIEPIGAETYQIDETEIVDNTFSQSFDYNDVISDAIVEYFSGEVSENPGSNTKQSNQVISSSDSAKYLHEIKKTMTQKSLHIYSADAQQYADRLAYMFGDRQSVIDFVCKNRFFGVEIADIINIERAAQNGFAYDPEVLNARKARVISSDKSMRGIKLTLDDLKGVNDNSANW